MEIHCSDSDQALRAVCSCFQSNQTKTLMLLISFAPDSKQISLHWFQTELFAFLLLFYFCFDSFALNTTLVLGVGVSLGHRYRGNI